MKCRICACGKEISVSNTAHLRVCHSYQSQVILVQDFIKNNCIAYYQQCLSVSETIQYILDNCDTVIMSGTLRRLIVSALKDAAVYQTLGDLEFEQKRQAKIKATLKNKYGVDNAGQREGNGWNKLNHIPYNKPAFLMDYQNFRSQVDRDLKKKKARGEINLLSQCEYTGIVFSDSQSDLVNPNDPMKRTIDHRIPVIECFIKGWTVEQTNADDNLVQCTRMINTLKNNTREEAFMELLPDIIRMIHESIESRAS